MMGLLLIFHKPTMLRLGNKASNILAGSVPWGKKGRKVLSAEFGLKNPRLPEELIVQNRIFFIPPLKTYK